MKRYNPKEIEPKWQQYWAENKTYQADDASDKPKSYVLDFFPYPSGAAMHVGHVRNYTISDVIARHQRMMGRNVLHPMGWDAFGLPAENYAIKTGISPQQAVAENTGKFKQQLIQMGIGIDWSREFSSSDPSYYKWTQWFFKLLFERGLAYQKESLQWWCDTDKTVLANEQVEAGKCWRCGNEVTKKPLKQWFFKITDYADRLIDDLDDLDWSDAIKAMQRNWIGRSKGAEVEFAIDGSDKKVQIFTTRPDTLFGATFMVLAPEHPLVNEITANKQRAEVEAYVKAAQAKSDIERQETNREKTGVFTGAYAVNPVNGEKIPIWVADYVLMGYGTGAIMAVPAHDERDYEFAKKFDLPIRQVVMPHLIDPDHPLQEGKENTERTIVICLVRNPKDGKILSLKWKKQPWQTLITGGVEDGEDVVEAAQREIREETGYQNLRFVSKLPYTIFTQFYAEHKDVNRSVTSNIMLFELTDEQRAEVAAEERDLHEVVWIDEKAVGSLWPMAEVEHVVNWLEKGDEVIFSGEGKLINSDGYDGLSTSDAREKIVADLAEKGVGKERVNYKIRDWLISRQRYWGAPIPIVHCPKDGAVAVPDDQLPVELPKMQSYEPSGDGRSPLARVPEWVNTTCPKCNGPATRETDTMDGFACSSWYFLRFADPHNSERPFDPEKIKYWLPVDSYVGGAEHAVMHLLYARFWTKVMQDAGLVEFGEPFTALRNQGMILAPDGRKMSKSWGNTIAPDDLIADGYGGDSIRVMELFIGPWDQSANWSTEGLGGCFRFLNRFWTLAQEVSEGKQDNADDNLAVQRIVHKTIKKVSQDLPQLGFNTAIASLMEAVNELYKLRPADGRYGETWQWAMKTLTQLLAPFAPHMTEELWQQFGGEGSVHLSRWPSWDEKLLVEEQMKIVVQVNGKVRAMVAVARGADEETVKAAALAHEHVQQFLAGKNPAKAIYVPGRLVNFVV